MYLIVIGYLALVLTLPEPLYRLVTGVGPVFVALAGATILPAVCGLLTTRRVHRLLEVYPARPAWAQAAFGRGMFLSQVALAAGHIGVLMGTDWAVLCRSVPVVGAWPVIPGLLTLAPFLLTILLLWVTTYSADRAIRQLALEIYLLRGRPLRPVWSLPQYLAYNLRHQVLFVLVPMLLILAASDLVTQQRVWVRRVTGLDFAPDLVVGAVALLVALLAPEILRHVWITQRLPAGPLRDRLLDLARRLRLRCRDILVWRSGGMVVNAAVMGLIPPVRYVLITDAMLEQMEETRIEAVFGHEAGHVKRHHIFFLLLFALISGCAATIFSVRTHGWSRTDPAQYHFALLLFGAGMFAAWVLLFGWISRRFERQADLAGVRALTLTGLPCGQPCLVHGHAGPAADPPAATAAPAVATAAPSVALCATAAHIFGDALHEVALLNGIRPEARSWRHSSIASRSRFLARLARDPDRLQRFERIVWWTKAALLVTAVVAAAWAGHDMRLWTEL
ncbi:MAG: M48 family metalloprotease, partial [Planctomycetota bacterium]